MKIGTIEVKSPVFLAPMAGITDYSFRILCKEQGAGIVYSEFVSAHGVVKENECTLDLIKFNEKERPIGIQIFGDDPKTMGEAADYISKKFKPDLIDINYGCPVPKVTKKGAGSAALKDLTLMRDITQAVVESVPELPVTVKMRAGWDKQSIVVEPAGTLLEAAGIKAITLHPRTTNQSYKGKSDWQLIKKLTEAVKIPVIGNGDISNPNDVIRMFDETQCDGVMIGRAALGNPWIFNQIITKLDNKTSVPPPTLVDRISTCRRHFHMLIESRGKRKGSYLIRKHFGWYIKGFPGAANFRNDLVTAPNLKTMEILLDQLSNYAIKMEKTDIDTSASTNPYA
ncbi:tRNA dihydrouridine synthase DusB [Candidatus Neomarinimicrobiota bacterium]